MSIIKLLNYFINQIDEQTYQVICKNTNTEICICNTYEGQTKTAIERAMDVCNNLNATSSNDSNYLINDSNDAPKAFIEVTEIKLNKEFLDTQVKRIISVLFLQVSYVKNIKPKEVRFKIENDYIEFNDSDCKLYLNEIKDYTKNLLLSYKLQDEIVNEILDSLVISVRYKLISDSTILLKDL